MWTISSHYLSLPHIISLPWDCLWGFICSLLGFTKLVFSSAPSTAILFTYFCVENCLSSNLLQLFWIIPPILAFLDHILDLIRIIRWPFCTYASFILLKPPAAQIVYLIDYLLKEYYWMCESINFFNLKNNWQTLSLLSFILTFLSYSRMYSRTSFGSHLF